MKTVWVFSALMTVAVMANGQNYNSFILEGIEQRMPKGGTYAKYEKSKVGQEFDNLHQTVVDLNSAIGAGSNGRKLTVKPDRAGAPSFCSSATYLLFVDVVSRLQASGLPLAPEVAQELAAVGDQTEVISGKRDGIGIFGHWNADGPGTAVLFQRLGLGTNFSNHAEARPGDFLKIFWNKNIGKGESGHLVVFLGTSEDGKMIEVWSSNAQNADGSSGYGKMWVEKSRIKMALFSRFEKPENLNRWKDFSEAEKSSDYLIKIRRSGSTQEEMKKVTGARN
jgi:hypothetical protein